MPREYRMLSTGPVDLTTVLAAARQVDSRLRPRLLFGGWAVQLVDERDIAVFTVEASRRLETGYQAGELLGSPAGMIDGEPGDLLWWTEASAPWGEYGEPGVLLARAIAVAVGARLMAEEGQ